MDIERLFMANVFVYQSVGRCKLSPVLFIKSDL
jgi:hypothetical protein